MPREDDQKPKWRPGAPSTRAFYNRIGFQLDDKFHEAMQTIAEERKLRFEDVYAEAVQHLLSIRENSSVMYTPSPVRRFAKRITIHMEPSLTGAVRAICQQDQRQFSDFFQTAVWLYLTHINRLPAPG